MGNVLLVELSALAEDIHVKHRKHHKILIYQNIRDIQEFLGINKTLQTMQDEMANNTSVVGSGASWGNQKDN